MRVLVCGGRDYHDVDKVFYELDSIHKQSLWVPITLIIHGGAAGADNLAKAWASNRYVNCKCFSANWYKHGKAAGPIRNKQMLDEGKPELVIAFPGGKGTANMIDQAKRRNIKVIEF